MEKITDIRKQIPLVKNYQKYLKLFSIIIFLYYCIIIGSNIGAYASGSDSSGYLNIAKLLLSGKISQEQRKISNLSYPEISQNSYIPLGFKYKSPDSIIPTYPFGIPIFIVITSFFFGLSNAAHIVIWIHTIGAGLLFYRLIRLFKIEVSWSLFASLILISNPLFLFYSSHLMSDIPSLFWSMLTMFCAIKSHKKIKYAAISGASIGIAILIRPTNLLLFIPTFIALKFSKKHWIYFILGGLPFAILLGTLNYKLYGNPLTNGYGNISPIFGTEFIKPSLLAYAKHIPLILTPIILAITLLPFTKSLKVTNHNWLILGSWILPFLIFYSFYYHTHETWQYIRFILPAFPPLIILAIISLRHFCKSTSKYKENSAILILSLMAILWLAAANKTLLTNNVKKSEYAYKKTMNWLNKNIEKNAVIFSMQTSGSIIHYTDFAILRYDLINKKDLQKIQNITKKEKIPIYVVLLPFELKNTVESEKLGKWDKVQEINDITILKNINNH